MKAKTIIGGIALGALGLVVALIRILSSYFEIFL